MHLCSSVSSLFFLHQAIAATLHVPHFHLYNVQVHVLPAYVPCMPSLCVGVYVHPCSTLATFTLLLVWVHNNTTLNLLCHVLVYWYMSVCGCTVKLLFPCMYHRWSGYTTNLWLVGTVYFQFECRT